MNPALTVVIPPPQPSGQGVYVSPSSPRPPASRQLPPQYGSALKQVPQASMLELNEYDDEMMEFLVNNEMKMRPDPTYMETLQHSITWKMRKTLVVWLIEVHKEYALRSETLYLCIHLLDRFSSHATIERSHYQLVGITCLWIAAKYEENHGRVPHVKNLSYMCCESYSEKEFILMERRILLVLGFDLGYPTCESFLKRLIRLNENVFCQVETRCLARYILDMTLLHRRFLHFSSNILAQASLLVSDLIVTGRCFRGVEEVELCRRMMMECLLDIPRALVAKYETVEWCCTSIVLERWLERRRVMESGLLTPPKESWLASFKWDVPSEKGENIFMDTPYSSYAHPTSSLGMHAVMRHTHSTLAYHQRPPCV